MKIISIILAFIHLFDVFKVKSPVPPDFLPQKIQLVGYRGACPGGAILHRKFTFWIHPGLSDSFPRSIDPGKKSSSGTPLREL